jgi:large subunit ribosomal protein L3
MQTLIGKKVGMTRIYDENGVQVPVTVVQVGPCVVVQRKTKDSDGYEAVQLGFEEQKAQRLAKAQVKHFEKAGVKPQKVLREVRVDGSEAAKAGDVLTAAVFEGVSFVDVEGHTKGRGFQGVIRRYGMRGGRESHGGAWTRKPGSIGNREWPARVFKNKKMPGQMGSEDVTTQNIRVVKVLADDNALLLEGAVPGPNGGIVLVRKAIKKA